MLEILVYSLTVLQCILFSVFSERVSVYESLDTSCQPMKSDAVMSILFNQRLQIPKSSKKQYHDKNVLIQYCLIGNNKKRKTFTSLVMIQCQDKWRWQVFSIMQKIPQISGGSKMKRSCSVSSNQNFRTRLTEIYCSCYLFCTCIVSCLHADIRKLISNGYTLANKLAVTPHLHL